MSENAANLTCEDKAYQEACERLEKLISASLCSNCLHQQDCTYLAGTTNPIQQCEMYECGPSPRPKLALIRRDEGAEDSVGNEASPVLGLCVNCDNRATCNLPKPLSGVWHCEEYC